jgi:hypothetical protein
MGRDVPHACHREVVDVADLGERDQRAFRPLARLDRSRVVRLLEPDAAPNAFGLDRRGQPAEALPQLADLYRELLIGVAAAPGDVAASRVRRYLAPRSHTGVRHDVRA